MDFNEIIIDDFFTDIYKSSFLSKNYNSFENFLGFEKNNKEVSFFDKSYLFDKIKRHELFDKYDYIKFYNLTNEEYKKFKEWKLKHNKMDVNITVLKFDEQIKKLEGKQYSKIRYYRNYFQKNYNFEILKKPKTSYDVENLIRKWKEVRKDSHFQFFIGYDINFWKKYYVLFKDRLISRFIYNGDELIAYFICECVNKHMYNQLYRKVDTNYSHLSLYTDLINFQTIYDKAQGPFLVNMEGDVGEDGLKVYKSENFPIFKVFKTIDVKIDLTKAPLEQFSGVSNSNKNIKKLIKELDKKEKTITKPRSIF